MLAQRVATVPTAGTWLYEIKWDGYRAQLVKDGSKVALLSRNGNDLTPQFPGAIDAAAALRAKSAVIDGELVAFDHDGRPSFQLLQNRRRDDPALLEFFAFDLLHLDGSDLCDRPIELRREALTSLIERTGIRLSATIDGEPSDIIAEVKRLGLEGIVAKRGGSPYRPGDRSGDWLKIKVNEEQEFVVGGFEPPISKPAALLVGYFERGQLVFASRVRNGFNYFKRRDLGLMLPALQVDACPFANLPMPRKGRWGEGVTAEDLKKYRWVRPEVVVQVSFVEWTAAGILRHPEFKGIRMDKRAIAVVRE